MRLEHFAEPPTKETNKLLADNNISKHKPETNSIKEQADKLLNEIAAQEAECLKTIHTRYCILIMMPINIADVGRYQPDKRLRPHYYEYWYKFGSKDEFMLMSRDLTATAEGMLLNIEFNKKLIREGE